MTGNLKCRILAASVVLFGGVLLTRGASLAEPQAKAPVPFVTQAHTDITGLPAPALTPRSTADLQAIQTRVEAVAKEALPATVAIIMDRGEGSGIIVSPDGYVLTAGHVSGTPNTPMQIVLSTGRRYNARALGANNDIDSGMVKISGTPPPGGFPFVPLGTVSNVVAGQWMVAIGHPGGLQTGRPPVVRLGKVLKEQGGNRAYIQTDCVLISGDSGGPVLDLDGRLVAINSRISPDTTENLHVPVDTFISTWDRLAKGEQWGGGRRLGLGGGGAVAAPTGARLGVIPGESDKGVLISGIAAGAAAENSDLKIGDIITGVDGQLIKVASDLAAIIGQHKAGDAVALEYLRGTRKLQVQVRLSEGTARTGLNLAAEKSSQALLTVFGQVVGAGQSTVGIQAEEGGPKVALGTIVSSDGYILTKASEVLGLSRVLVALGSGAGNTARNYEATIVGVSQAQDLAMLKIRARGLMPVTWAHTVAPPEAPVVAGRGRGFGRSGIAYDSTPPAPVVPTSPAVVDPHAVPVDVGQWVASAGPVSDYKDQPIAVGVISVTRRRIPPLVYGYRQIVGYLGVRMMDTANRGGAQIRDVSSDSPAERAGLQANDIVTSINGASIAAAADLTGVLSNLRPGDVATMMIKRAGKNLTIRCTLGSPLPTDPTEVILTGGAVSKRASDFASVFQHDTIIRPSDCGGPLVDLEGRVLGINIARAGRTETYAIPADVIVPLLEPLESGKLAPAGAGGPASPQK